MEEKVCLKNPKKEIRSIGTLIIYIINKYTKCINMLLNSAAARVLAYTNVVAFRPTRYAPRSRICSFLNSTLPIKRKFHSLTIVSAAETTVESTYSPHLDEHLLEK